MSLIKRKLIFNISSLDLIWPACKNKKCLILYVESYICLLAHVNLDLPSLTPFDPLPFLHVFWDLLLLTSSMVFVMSKLLFKGLFMFCYLMVTASSNKAIFI